VTGPSDEEIFTRLHARLARPYEVIGTLSALVGEAPAAITQGVGLAMATSHEAQVLLAGMPATVRSLATSLQAHNQRCIGELRGPVMWSETMSARASSFGDRDLFICATPSRAYDIDENRILVAALGIVRDAGRDATDRVTGPLDDPVLRLARKVGSAAGRWLDHPSLSPISRVRPNPRALRRTRSGKHRKTYQPALDLLDRAADPISAEEAFRWCRPIVHDRHRLLMGLVDRLEQDDRRQVPLFRAEHGALLAGPLVFYAGRHDGAGLSGLLLGPLLIDVLCDRTLDRASAEAELEARSGGRPTLLVTEDADIDKALLRAVEIANTAPASPRS
jgi:hypothetical protein